MYSDVLIYIHCGLLLVIKYHFQTYIKKNIFGFKSLVNV